MKKTSIALIALINLLFISLPIFNGLALTEPEPPRQANICCDEDSILVAILNYMIWILLIVAAIFIVIAAYFFVTAAGNPDTIKRARDFVLYALVGVLVAVLARGLVWFIAKVAGFEDY